MKKINKKNGKLEFYNLIIPTNDKIIYP